MESSKEEPGEGSQNAMGRKNKEAGLQKVLGAGCWAERCLLSTILSLNLVGDRGLSFPQDPPKPGTRLGEGPGGFRGAQACDAASSGWARDPYRAQQGPRSASLSPFSEQEAQDRNRGGGWLPPRTQGRGCGSGVSAWGHWQLPAGPPFWNHQLSGPGQWAGGQPQWAAAPRPAALHGDPRPLSSAGPPGPCAPV